jgi:hypothetical protein
MNKLVLSRWETRANHGLHGDGKKPPRVKPVVGHPNKENRNMNESEYIQKASAYLKTLCSVKPNRRTGSPGNREATAFFASIANQFGYKIDTTPFACLDFASGQSSFVSNGHAFEIQISPYSLGVAHK